MLFAVLVLLCAIGVGYALRGSLSGLGELGLRQSWLVVLAVLAQLVGGIVGGRAWGLGLAVSVLAVLGFLLRNRGVLGTGLVALGLAANAAVITANGAMPVSPDASGRAGISTQALLRGESARHELQTSGTRLPWLGDVIPVLVPGRAQVVSPGDLLVTAGLAELVVAGMLRRRRRDEGAPRLAPPAERTQT